MTKFRFDHTAGVVAAAMLAFAVPASAANSNSNSNASNANRQAAEATQRQADERQICVRIELSNSRISRRVCKTAEEWEAAGGLPTQDR